MFFAFAYFSPFKKINKKMSRRRCDCGADAQHEHLLAREQRPGTGILGGNTIALNPYIRRPDCRAWNCTIKPPTANGVHNVFSTTSNNNRLANQQPSQQNQSDTNPSTNSSATSSSSALLYPDDPTYVTLRSDADEELLIYVPFSEFLNVRAMMVVCDANSCPPPEEPSSLHIFVNRQDAHLGFSDVRRAAPSQQLRLGSASSPGDAIIYSLDAAKFRGVGSMTLFFKASYGGEKTQVSRIVFFGESTREPVERGVVRNVVTETMADPAEHVRRLQAEANTRAVS